ncbi:uncharacterized protein LOC117123935 [Anneissia japonica]|uniref:uncharacterized protein LOC117123935 n=1 Tax=Anneissia japonica TaxID=1529436 RepID=UPI0014258D6C|nr:uncharacterized protein LOC117123935 [Anneissia japonica]XP_033125923.1 uncharacterized protein LOC117123935 [Anneissia japonica]
MAIVDLLHEEKLIAMWPDYQCLYDVRSVDFKNKDLRQQAIGEIAEKVEENVDWVKNKLRLLRNSYTKAKAKKSPLSPGSVRKKPTKRIAWLLEKLQFLEPYVATRGTVAASGTIHQNREKKTTDGMTSPMTSLVANKKKEQEADDVDHFFNSMAVSVKAMPPNVRALVKFKIHEIVFQAENELMMNTQT